MKILKVIFLKQTAKFKSIFINLTCLKTYFCFQNLARKNRVKLSTIFENKNRIPNRYKRDQLNNKQNKKVHYKK